MTKLAELFDEDARCDSFGTAASMASASASAWNGFCSVGDVR